MLTKEAAKKLGAKLVAGIADVCKALGNFPSEWERKKGILGKLGGKEVITLGTASWSMQTAKAPYSNYLREASRASFSSSLLLLVLISLLLP
jgi:hypothetical protein